MFVKRIRFLSMSPQGHFLGHREEREPWYSTKRFEVFQCRVLAHLWREAVADGGVDSISMSCRSHKVVRVT